jgi:argininosuccinate lyase
VPLSRAHELLAFLLRTVQAIVVDPQRSLAEVNRDYSAMTNLAEVLVQSAGLPFREAHEFASRLTDYGRARGLQPGQISYVDACGLHAAPLPIDETEYTAALDPSRIVESRRGRGGPQSAEIERMLAEAGEAIGVHQTWLADRQGEIAEARAARDGAFNRLMAAARPLTSTVQVGR